MLQRVSTYLGIKYLGLSGCVWTNMTAGLLLGGQGCWLLFRVRQFVSRHSMVIVYYALIHSHIVHLLDVLTRQF